MPEPDGDQRVQTLCLVTLTMIALGAALAWLRPVLVPFVLAVFLAITLMPVTNFCVRTLRISHTVAVMVTLTLVFVVFFVVSGVLTSSLGQLEANWHLYVSQLEQHYDELVSRLRLDRLGAKKEGFDLQHLFGSPGGTLREILLLTTNSLLEVISQGILVMIFMLFILFGAQTRDEPTGGVWGEIESRVKRYITAKFVVSGTTGVLVAIILAVLGVDFALAFGFLAFVLNFIPSVGSIIATLLPLPVLLLMPDVSLAKAILAIGLPGGVQFLVGNVLEPKILGRSLDLHPIVVLLALIFWGTLWGIVGMLLATPITAVLKIVLERIEVTAPLGDMLAGRIDRWKED